MSKPPPAFWQDPEGDGQDVAPPEPDDAEPDDADAPDGDDAPEADGSARPRSADR